MKLFIKVGTSKAGVRYHALCLERWGIEKTLTFDIEAILLATGFTLEQLTKLDNGKHVIKF